MSNLTIKCSLQYQINRIFVGHTVSATWNWHKMIKYVNVVPINCKEKIKYKLIGYYCYSVTETVCSLRPTVGIKWRSISNRCIAVNLGFVSDISKIKNSSWTILNRLTQIHYRVIWWNKVGITSFCILGSSKRWRRSLLVNCIAYKINNPLI